MLSTRNVIIGVVAVAVCSVFFSVVELLSPPDNGGEGFDTYGTKVYGLRGVYDTLDELGQDVTRGLTPPSAVVRDAPKAGLVFWAPYKSLVDMDAAYVNATGEWIKKGGVAYVALPLRFPQANDDEDDEDDAKDGGGDTENGQGDAFESNDTEIINIKYSGKEAEKSSQAKAQGWAGQEDETRHPLLEGLGLKDVTVEMYLGGPTPAKHISMEILGRYGSFLWAFWQARLQTARTFAVRAEGTLAPLAQKVRTLRLPEQALQAILTPEQSLCSNGPMPDGRVYFVDDDGIKRTLVAAYNVGKGSVVVLSDPAIFVNGLLGKADNGVLAGTLFTGTGRSLVFDEYFHGLNVRGNFMWLLTRSWNSLVVVLFFLLVCLALWRAGVRLGPALREKRQDRRDMEEYVEAMANLMYRGNCHGFLLNEVKAGVLWGLRRRLHLGLGKETTADVAKALERRDPAAAKAFLKASNHLDELVRARKHPANKDMAAAAREIVRCL